MQFSFAADAKSGLFGQVKQGVTEFVVKSALGNSGPKVLHAFCLLSSTSLVILSLTCTCFIAISTRFTRDAVFANSVSHAVLGVMRHGLDAAYYANQNKPFRAVQEVGAAIRDAVTGSRK
jgi:hypothetical protein